jgi:ferredoxin
MPPRRVVTGGAEKQMKVRVDHDKCVGHGVCEALDRDVFRVGEDGFSHLITERPSEDHRRALLDAVYECPTGALSIQD